MNINDLKPAGSLAQRFGVKCLVYGGPGSGKTPLMETAPNPVACICEPGLLSIRDATVPAFEAYTPERVDEFFKWLFQSKEADKFDTVCIDSISQLAEIVLVKELNNYKDGRKAYGEMSRTVMSYINGLYFMPRKHVYLIAKQAVVDDEGTLKKRPYFPGQDLNVKVPHLYDEILHIAKTIVPGVVEPQIAIRTKETFNTMARDRSGNLEEYEPPHLANLFSKAMR